MDDPRDDTVPETDDVTALKRRLTLLTTVPLGEVALRAHELDAIIVPDKRPQLAVLVDARASGVTE